MIQMNLEGIPCPLITFCCSHNCVAFKIIWCKGKNFYDKGKGINAEPLTDKKHKVGVNGWTVEDHLAYRQSYAPDILQDLLEKLEEISSRKDLLPKSTLAQAVGYALNEYNAICDIFKRGDTALDNNYIERIQRYISLSRRNSMFFGSHEGAGRAAILYSIAISCRLNGINLFEYICDVIEKTAEWQPNTPWEKYRDLLPDRWKKQQQH